jgi:tagatose 6-phosphate kinase
MNEPDSRPPAIAPGVLCVGVTPALQRTLWVDAFRLGDVNRIRSVEWTGGGKATNVSRVLRILGARSVLTGFCGGHAGRRLSEILAAEGLESDFVQVEDETRLCQTVVDNADRQATELVEESALPPPEAWDRLAERIRAHRGTCRMLVFSGRLPPGAPPNAYRRLIETADPSGCRVFLDTPRQPLLEAMGARVELVKVNSAELSATFGDDSASRADWPRGIDRLREAGVKWVLVTNGPDPVWLAGPGAQRLRYRVPPVTAVNPIGSGDAALAGIIFALLQGDEMPEAVRFGLACGSANALTATAGVLRPEDVERIRADVTVC